MAILPYISDSDLITHTSKLVDAAKRGEKKVYANPYNNVIDPFSALVDAARQNISLEEWMKQEQARQIQKSFQNAIGEFHQQILGSIGGWNNAGAGGSYDVINNEMKIIAEVKNKYNTMNSSSALNAYDKMAHWLDYGKSGYRAFIVEIVPEKPLPYSVPFTPSDRKVKRQTRENLRRIDGRSFYALATGIPQAIDLLYKALPDVLDELLNTSEEKLTRSVAFDELFSRVYLQ
jgi:hypothetical protein